MPWQDIGDSMKFETFERYLVALEQALDHLQSLPIADTSRVALLVVPQGFPIWRRMFLAKMAATRLVAFQRVSGHQFGKLEKIGDTPGFLERLIEVLTLS